MNVALTVCGRGCVAENDVDDDGNAMEETCLTEGANANAVDDDVAVNEEEIIKLVVVRCR